MRCPFLPQDRVDISEAITCLYTSDVETECRSHDAIETSGEVPERSAKKSTAMPRARAKQSAFGSSRGQRSVWRHSNASEHVRSDCAARTTLAQTQLNSTITSLDSVVQKVSTTHLHKRGRMFRIGSAKLVCRLELEGTTLIAYKLFEREGSCFANRRWQEHSSFSDEVAMATGTCSSKTLASCESGNGIKSCRHDDKCTWEIES